MKKIVLFVAVTLLAVSCAKERPVEDGAAERVPDSPVFVCQDGCPVCDLIHYEPTQASYYKSGNNEFWKCPHCGAMYSDACARERFTGFAYILPTRIIRGEENLRILNGDISGGTKGVYTLIVKYSEDIALASTIAGIATGLTSLGASIAALCENNDEIEAALAELSGQLDKTAAEIDQMLVKVKELQASVKLTATEMSKTYSLVDSLYQQVDSLVIYSRSYKTTSEQILSAVDNIDYDYHLRKLLDDRHHDLMAVTDPSLGAIGAVKVVMGRDLEYLNYAEDYNDSLSVLRLCLMDVNNVVSSWGSDNANYADVTSRLLKSYSKISNRSSESFPSVLESYINSHIAWEQQGYGYRVKNMLMDQVFVSVSYYLARIYFNNCAGWDRGYADLKIADLDADYQKMVSLAESTYETIIHNDSLFRRSLITGHCFEKVLLNAYDEMTQYLSTLETLYGSAEVISEFDKHDDLYFHSTPENALTLEDWESMQQISYANRKTLRNVLLTEENGGMGFLLKNDADRALADHWFGLSFPYTDMGEIYLYNYFETYYMYLTYMGDGCDLRDEELGDIKYESSMNVINMRTPYYLFALMVPYTQSEQ